ncbi:hypothetical protein [Jannaschia seohaensis]|uniref:Uncharacterized protein n=1 Tax=Jannaschia seohaensis TaxID=475081 RepID=A0A2Y9ATK8_9RHOB|nr:hypothetical protein [Jannaschia seohaensis]PWJ19165.1 hypothetical protein BCF38_10496 [Jannaschia seohaensis]SSA45827.1 hypothetical protein SAMN05421539_10496 [Jannaschia seohaensis]
MRRLVLPLLATATALPAAAQERSLWELIHPDRLAASVVRSGVLALRSQMDLRYSDLSVSIAEGTLAIDDLEVTLYDNITDGPVCDISIGGMEVLTGDPFDASRMEFSLAARAVTLAPDCLPPDAGPLAMMMGPAGLSLPQVVMDVVYDMPSAAAQARIETGLAGVLAATLDLDFDYVTLWAGEGQDPEPSGDLRAASLILENLGGWEVAQGFLPPPLIDPDQAGAAITQMLSGMLSAQAEDGVLPKHGKTFVTEVAQGWSAFVADPDRLVIETGFSPDAPLFLEPSSFEDGALALIEGLQPIVRQAPAAERAALPPALVVQALDTPDTLTEAQRREVGLALLRGEGAPLAEARGLALLSGLAQQDGEVALAVAEALSARDPAAAYSAALVAGVAGAPGAQGLMDRLEDDLDFAARLDMQAEAAGALDGLDASPRDLAARAQAHFSGQGAVRSLQAAQLYASLAGARGDRGAVRLLDRIDRSIPDAAWPIWEDRAAEMADIALAAWSAAAR